MTTNNHLVNLFNGFKNLLALLLMHKNMGLFILKPVIIIQNHHKPVAQFSSFFNQPNMSNVNWIKRARYGNYNLFFVFCHKLKFICVFLFPTYFQNKYMVVSNLINYPYAAFFNTKNIFHTFKFFLF